MIFLTKSKQIEQLKKMVYMYENAYKDQFHKNAQYCEKIHHLEEKIEDLKKQYRKLNKAHERLKKCGKNL